MVKILKIVGRIIVIPLEWLLISAIVFLFVIRLSSFQTYLAEKAASYFSKELKTTVSVNKVDIILFNKIYLDGFLILDREKDTLLSLKTLEASFDGNSLLSDKIKVTNVKLDDGLIKVVKSAKSKEFNFQFLVDYFKSDEPSDPSSPIDLAIKKININNFSLHYHDFNAKRTPFSFNENHIDISKLNVSLEEISSNKQGLNLAIKQLSLKESCGLVLNNLCGKLAINDKSVDFSQAIISLNSSVIKASKIAINWNSQADLDAFVDKVIWKIKFQPSKILLSDIAFFVPEMKGMNNQIRLQGDATNTLSHLFLKGIKLDYAKNTHIHADLELPNFSDFSAYDFIEKIHSASIDMSELQNFILPYPSGKLNLGDELNQLGIVRLANFTLTGNNGAATIAPTTIKTSLGDASILQAIRFSNLNKDLVIAPKLKDSSCIAMRNFNLGKLLQINEIKNIDGEIGFSDFIIKEDDIQISGINAKFNTLQALDYSYSSISISGAKLEKNIFDGKVAVNDKNLSFDYSGKIGFGKIPFYDLSLKINKAKLDLLGFTAVAESDLLGSLKINIVGDNLKNLQGTISVNDFLYQEKEKDFSIPNATLSIRRSLLQDEIKLNSSLLDLDLVGKINPLTVLNDFTYELSRIFPSIASNLSLSKGGIANNFTYNITTKNLDNVLNLFVPGLKIAENTKIKGGFNANNGTFLLLVDSKEVMYDSIILKGIDINQNMTSNGFFADYKIAELILADSISLNDIDFLCNGTQGLFQSTLKWDPNGKNFSALAWQTRIRNSNDFLFTVEPSFFSINDIRWDIFTNSTISLVNSDVNFNNLLLQRKNQEINIDGKLSNNPNEVLILELKKIDLSEISQLLKLDVQLAGLYNGNVSFRNSGSSLNFSTLADISNLYINQQELGDIKLKSDYDSKSETINANGEVKYHAMPALDFNGSYFMNREKDNLAVDLHFTNTDLHFLNGFMDSTDIRNIQGTALGEILVRGSIDAPELLGKLTLVKTAANIELLGVRYTLDGDIRIDKNQIEIKNLPVTDQDGNIAYLKGEINHTNFDKWDYRFKLNFQEETNSKFNKSNNSKRFLLLNTKYREGDYYFGKAYGIGYANISGYGSKMNVDVNIETKMGSQINFPMYGISDIDEDNLVHFVAKNNQTVVARKENIDFTGLNLNMKFKLTPEAKLKIIFNEQLGDEISAYGSGDIILKLDDFNNLKMEGAYTIQKGSSYNFAMGPLKQTFDIQQGSKITWTGDVEKASIDLLTAFTIKKVSLLDLSPELEDKTLASQDVNCFLKLSETLDKPKINFEIQAPNASETGKSLISRVNAETDELNRQFFSLLLVKKFQSITGTISASSSAALDLVESQINGLLGQLSKDYKVNVDLGESNALASVQKNFLNDRLLVTGSFGVQNNSSSGQSTSGFIGDVSLEYLVNKKGTLRVNAFNKSNTNTVDENSGPFTQGAGLSYHEEFNNLSDFELYQAFMDTFRPKDKKYFKSRRKKKQTRIPPLVIDNGNIPALKKE
ncbi:MAG: hypothetical protein NT109_10480 [Flavobacteriia bacterium]|nr:hypothetical protein [Flavobacteriia bacterium]